MTNNLQPTPAHQQPLATEQEPSPSTNQTVVPPEEPSTTTRAAVPHSIPTTAHLTLLNEHQAILQTASDLSKLSSPPQPDLTTSDKETDSPTIPHSSSSNPIQPKSSNPSLQPSPLLPPPPPTNTPPTPLPTPSQPGPSLPSRPARHSKTPTRKKLIRFLLPCFHPSLHDEPSTILTKPPPLPLHLPHPSSLERAQPAPATDQPPPASPLHPSGTTRRSPMLMAKQHLRKTKSSSPTASSNITRRTPSSQCLPTPVSDTVTPAGAAAATSAANAHGGAGVQVPIDETEGVLSGAVVPPGKDTMAIRKSASALRLVARNQLHTETLAAAAGVHQATERAETDEASIESDDPQGYQDIEDDEDDEEDRIVVMGGMGIPLAPDGTPRPLLTPLDPSLRGRKCLVLDLDETLVHSSFKVIPQSDFVVPVEIENSIHNVHVIKRPGVDEFMKKMGEIYEVVVFTASLSKYADPVLDMLDIHHVVKHRLFRESCYNHKGNYVKDLSQLGRPIADTIIIDNSPASYVFHPNNAVPVSSWFNDPHDTELTDLAAFLTDIANVPDVRGILDPRL